ncbi:MAG: Uma2 family endonuclease [Selenomonadaceae bacterium]|nr:Uma2 family endonuclease [Selenomonadaceae bacterium]MBR1858709.1 Uma2 family endonuclease [Selenomonadaceae bacterium]
MNTAIDYNYDERPYEIIDGEARMMASPSINHMRINSNIDFAFKKYLKGKTCESFINSNVYFNEDDHFIPDEMIVCNPDIVEENAINGTPDLIVEILSPSTAKTDKNDKFLKYEKYGVKEYWIVDPKNKSVDVYHLKEGRFMPSGTYQLLTDEQFNNLSDKDKVNILTEIKVSFYDDFIVNVKDIFERVK